MKRLVAILFILLFAAPTATHAATDFESCASEQAANTLAQCRTQNPGNESAAQTCASNLVPEIALFCRDQFPENTSSTAPAQPRGAGACKGATCTRAEVGPFMQDIAAACYNTGDCQLTDVMTVVNNVGVFILGIVGALVFLMYTISGVRWIGAAYLPGGFDENIKKGKDGLRIATIGLVIVFVAFAAITTLKTILCTDTSIEACK